jgi:hypothetical protein
MIEENKTYIVEYPFCRDKYHVFDEEGGGEIDTWRPGTRQMNESTSQYDHEHWAEADAMGEMILSVISVHRPGNYPLRVFFTRQWKDPDGKMFGRSKKLHIKAVSAFKSMLRGYRHKYTLLPQI